MREATQAALAYGKKQHEKLGYPGNPEAFAAGLNVSIIVGSDNYASDGPPSVISRTPDSYAPRQRFTIFHELAHVLVQRGKFERDILSEVEEDDAEPHLEAVANHMAGMFLLPDPLIENFIQKYGFTPEAVLQIQRHARASFAATIRRLVAYDLDAPTTIFLSGEKFILDIASTDPWNRLYRYQTYSGDEMRRETSGLLTADFSRGRTVNLIR